MTGDGGEAGGLGPGGDEVGVVEGGGGAAAAAEASSGGEGAVAGGVVELAGGAEGLEVFADGGFGEAELGGELALGEGLAASPAFPAVQELLGC